MKPGGGSPLRSRPEPAIRWRGRRLPIAEACALAVREHQAGNFQAVADIYNLVLAQVPGYAEGHNNRGVVLQLLKKYGEALASYDKALALKPEYANAHFNRATTLKKLGRLDEALAGYDRAIALRADHAEAHLNRGVLLQELRRYREALASYDRVIALKPGHPEAHNNRGIVLMSIGDMPQAEKMFVKASELKPDFTDPLFNLAVIRNHQNADTAEVKHLRALLDQPALPPTEKEHLSFTLGKIYDDAGHALRLKPVKGDLQNLGIGLEGRAFHDPPNAIDIRQELGAASRQFANDMSTACFQFDLLGRSGWEIPPPGCVGWRVRCTCVPDLSERSCRHAVSTGVRASLRAGT